MLETLRSLRSLCLLLWCSRGDLDLLLEWECSRLRGDLELLPFGVYERERVVLRRLLLLSDSESGSESSLSPQDEEEEEEEDDPELELSELNPVGFCRSTCFAMAATSGRSFCSVLNHLRESFGRPRTVLCQTMGKLVTLLKFCVTATVSVRFTTTCHHPLGTKTVSPGFCKISSGLQSCGHEGDCVRG